MARNIQDDLDEDNFREEIEKYGITWLHGDTVINNDISLHRWKSEWFTIEKHKADLEYCGCIRMYRDDVHYLLQDEAPSDRERSKYSYFELELAFIKAAKILREDN